MSAKFAFPNLQTTTAPGSGDGYLTFANALGFAVGAKAFLSDPSGNNTVEVQITAVTATLVGVVALSELPYSYGRTNFSAYATGSTLDQYGPQVTPFGAGANPPGGVARGADLFKLEVLSTRAGIPAFPVATGTLFATTGQEVTNAGLATGGYCLGRDGFIHFLPSHTNLALWSQDYTNGAWSKSSVTATLASGIAPDGTNTANLMSCAAGHAEFQFFQDISTAAGGNITFSVYVKQTGASKDFVTIWLGGGSIYAIFQFSTASFITVAGTTSTQVDVLANGWYRIQWTAVVGSGDALYVIKQADTATNALPGFAWTATGFESILVWGAQVQIESPASKYIATTSAAITLGPVRVTPSGLLCEGAATNDTPWSNTFFGNWTTNFETYTPGQPGPDGLNSATKVTSNGTTSPLYNFIATTFGSATTCVISLYAKAGTLGFICVGIGNTSNVRATFDLNAGVVSNVHGTNAYMESLANGWYRCIVSGSIVGGDSYSIFTIGRVADNVKDNNFSVGGTTTTADYLYVFGFQVEENAGQFFATSFIPTVGAAGTRPTDKPQVHNPLSDLPSQPLQVWRASATILPIAGPDWSYYASGYHGYLASPNADGSTNSWALYWRNGSLLGIDTYDPATANKFLQNTVVQTVPDTGLATVNGATMHVFQNGVDIGGTASGAGTGRPVQNSTLSIGYVTGGGITFDSIILRDIYLDNS